LIKVILFLHGFFNFDELGFIFLGGEVKGFKSLNRKTALGLCVLSLCLHVQVFRKVFVSLLALTSHLGFFGLLDQIFLFDLLCLELLIDQRNLFCLRIK
jgi:hypothetical protein